MAAVSIESTFLPITTDDREVSALRARLKRCRGAAEQFETLAQAPFDTAYDLLRSTACEQAAQGESAAAVSSLAALVDASPVVQGKVTDEPQEQVDIHAALMQIITALHVGQGALDVAATSAAECLHYLAQFPRRKDVTFQQLLGSLLYDIACLHGERGEHKQAEREIEKSNKVFERLAKNAPERYATPHMMALNAATVIYRNRVRQAELLAHYQASTTAYMEMLNAGVDEAAVKLAESLGKEGDTLARMGKHREAIQYYSRALKYLTKVETTFSLAQLRLSIALGESMLSVGTMRDKGVHLLNTMLHKATKINALDEHRRIVDSLYHAKSRSLDILSLWHKVFPK